MYIWLSVISDLLGYNRMQDQTMAVQQSIVRTLYTDHKISSHPIAENWVWAQRWAHFENTYHTITIQPNAPSITKNKIHTVKFIKTDVFGCETQSLVSVFILYASFHIVSAIILTSSLPVGDTIYSTLHQRLGIHSWYLSGEGKVCVLGYEHHRP